MRNRIFHGSDDDPRIGTKRIMKSEKKDGTVINKKAGKSCGKRKIVQISNASSELIKATIQEKHMSYRGLAKLTGMNVSVISHMCAGTQKRFNKKTISETGICVRDFYSRYQQ